MGCGLDDESRAARYAREPEVKKLGGSHTRGRLATLEPKQARFVSEYLVDLNATQAAIRAGYSRRSAQMQGSRLLSNAMVSAAVAAGQAVQIKKIETSAERVLLDLARVAHGDLRVLFDEHDNLKQLSTLSDDAAALLASVETERGMGGRSAVKKVKLWDKLRALEMLAKHLGLLVEQTEHSGVIELQWGQRDPSKPKG